MAGEEEEFEDGEFEDSEITVEDRARTMGWKPREEYRGDPRRWTSAEEFIAHGEAELPILRDQNRRMSEKLVKFENEVGSLQNTVAEQAAAIQDAMGLARRADAAGYKRGMDELKAKQREAVAVGDTEAYDQIEEQIETAERERAAANVTTPVAKVHPPKAPELAQETTDFIADNPWFNAKPILRNAMIAAHQEIMQNSPNMPLADQYAAAKAEVVESFPQFFPDGDEEDEDVPAPRQRPRLRAQPLAPTGAASRQRPGKSAFERIADPAERAEAKAAFANISKYDPEATEDEYVTLYLNPKTDVLQMRAARGKRTVQ